MEFRSQDDFLINPQIVGENMRWIRTKIYELSQTEVARRLDISRSTLHRLEEGQNLPSLELLHSFARLGEGHYFQPVMFFVRRLSPFHPRDICMVARYFEAIYQTPDQFLVAWHIRAAATLELLAMEEGSPAGLQSFFFSHLPEGRSS